MTGLHAAKTVSLSSVPHQQGPLCVSARAIRICRRWRLPARQPKVKAGIGHQPMLALRSVHRRRSCLMRRATCYRLMRPSQSRPLATCFPLIASQTATFAGRGVTGYAGIRFDHLSRSPVRNHLVMRRGHPLAEMRRTPCQPSTLFLYHIITVGAVVRPADGTLVANATGCREPAAAEPIRQTDTAATPSRRRQRIVTQAEGRRLTTGILHGKITNSLYRGAEIISGYTGAGHTRIPGHLRAAVLRSVCPLQAVVRVAQQMNSPAKSCFFSRGELAGAGNMQGNNVPQP